MNIFNLYLTSISGRSIDCFSSVFSKSCTACFCIFSFDFKETFISLTDFFKLPEHVHVVQ